MTTRPSKPDRRTDALSKARIVAAAIEILDAEGEDALTFRALAARLATGSGALYWHVADKGALLAAAADDVVTRAIAPVAESTSPRDAIRTIALGLFDAIDARPWVGAQLAREPWQISALKIYEAIGSRLYALKVPDEALFVAWSTLVSFILGAAGQNAANARMMPSGTDRSVALAAIAEGWDRLDPKVFPFVSRMAADLRDHDDRAQFLAGVDLILAGLPAPSEAVVRP